MEELLPYAAATAAVLAAVFSGLTLVISGRRVDRQWRREALAEAIVDFLETELRGVGIARDLLRARSGLPVKERGRPMTESEMWVAHDHCAHLITRLRILAGVPTYNAAYESHEVFDEYLRLWNANGKVDEEFLSDHSKATTDAHDKLVAGARREFGVRQVSTPQWLGAFGR